MAVNNSDELLLAAKDAEIARLRAEMDKVKGQNFNLWRAVGELQLASGLAWAWVDTDDNSAPGLDHFRAAVEHAENLLDGVIGLTPAE